MSWTDRRAALLLGLRLGLVFGLLPSALPAAAAEGPPEKWVRKIEVRGAHQISRPLLLRRIDLKSWRPLPPDAAATVPGQVAEAYARSGLPAPEVTVAVGEPDARGATRVTLDLVESPLPRLDSLGADLGGLPWVTSLPTRVKLLVRKVDAKLSRWNRKELDDLLRREQRRLRGLGWKRAAFRVEEEETKGGASRAVSVTLDLGPREKLAGKGVDRKVMREVAATWKRRNVPLSSGVIHRLERAADEGMTERGYTGVEVTHSEKQEGNLRTVVLEARHGPRLSVGEIRFEGAESIPADELSEAMPLFEPRLLGLSRSYPGPELLEESRLALLDAYARAGFPAARVEVEVEGPGEKPAVVFRVNEGRRQTIASLAFPGASAIGEDELRKASGLEVGKPWWPGGDADAAEAVRLEYARRGYDDAVVTPHPGEEDSEGRVPLAFAVAEGSLYRFGDVTVRGNYKTKASRILSLGDERAGRVFDGVKLTEHQARLGRLGVFDTVTVIAVPVPGASPPEKAVVVEVVERSTRYVEYGFDVNTKRGFELAGTLVERNLFGRAVHGSLSALAGTVRQSAVLEVGQPSLFGTRLDNSVRASYVLDASFDGFSLQTVGAEAGLSLEIDPRKRVTLVYRIEEQKPLDVAPDVEVAIVPVTARIGSLTPTVSLDLRDDPFLTSTGMYLLVRDKASREAFGGDVDFDRLEVDARKFRDLGSGVTLGGALRAGYARAHGSATLPIGERFFPGGASTHRGFRERELGPEGEDGSNLGGTSYFVGNAELRAPLLGPLEGGLFLDAGNAWEGGIDLGDLRWAAGLGLRLRTAVGPLRVDAGFLFGPRPGESRTVFHLALGHAF